MEKTQTKRFCLIKLTKYASDERLKNSVILHAGQHANTCCGIGPESVAKREGLARSLLLRHVVSRFHWLPEWLHLTRDTIQLVATRSLAMNLWLMRPVVSLCGTRPTRSGQSAKSGRKTGGASPDPRCILAGSGALSPGQKPKAHSQAINQHRDPAPAPLQLSGESVNHLASMTKHDGYLGPVSGTSASASASDLATTLQLAGWHFDISLRGFWSRWRRTAASAATSVICPAAVCGDKCAPSCNWMRTLHCGLGAAIRATVFPKKKLPKNNKPSVKGL